MPISMTTKMVYTTSDGQTHNTRLDAHRHETRTTLEQLGVQGDTALKLLTTKPTVLRGIASALAEFADQAEAIAKGTANDVPELGAWPDDANVAPRKGEPGYDEAKAAAKADKGKN